MEQIYWLILIGITIGFLTWRWLKSRRPNLRLDDELLVSFLEDLADYEVFHPISHEADSSIQFTSPTESVKYHNSLMDGGSRLETIDLNRKGYAGFIATFDDGRLRELRRIGGRTLGEKELSANQLRVLYGLLNRMRLYADLYIRDR